MKKLSSKTPEGKGEAYLVFTDFTDEATESLLHVDAMLGRCLDESTPKLFGEFAALCGHNSQQISQHR